MHPPIPPIDPPLKSNMVNFCKRKADFGHVITGNPVIHSPKYLMPIIMLMGVVISAEPL
jgi:hypothetical protein